MSTSVTRSQAPKPVFGELDAHTAAALLAVAGDLALIMDDAGIIQQVALGGSGDSQFDGTNAWIGRAWSDTVSTDSRPKIQSLVKEAISQGISKRRQVNHLLGEAQDVPVAYTAMRLGRDGNLVAVGRAMKHVSALQQKLVEAQQAMERDYWRLRHVETRFRLLFQLASDGILVLDATSLKVLDANGAAGQIFGDNADRLIGRIFPINIDTGARRVLEDLVAQARSAGRGSDVPLALADGRRFSVTASCFRQESSTLLLVRFSPSESSAQHGASSPSRLADLVERSPDGFVVTDLEGEILTANRAFLDMAELANEEQIRGESLSTFIGRPGADFAVFTTVLRKHGVVRLMATSARGALGHQSEVEVSAVWVPEGEEPCIGFSIRDIGRRLAAGPQGARDLTRAVEDLTGLVGRVQLRDLVRDTADLLERHFIEAALELTNDNRTSAAEVLGVSRQSLYVKMRRHRLASLGAEREEDEE